MRYSAVTACLICVLLAACQGGKAEGDVRSDGFPAPDKEFVWNVAASQLRNHGFAPDSEGSSKQTWTIVTHWKTSLQPFSNQGHRERATVTVHDVPGRPNYFFTRTQVARQRNENMIQPGNPVVADWSGEERVPELESFINRNIELYFLPGAASADFRERYGVEGGASRRVLQDELSPAPPTGPAPPTPYSPYGPSER